MVVLEKGGLQIDDIILKINETIIKKSGDVKREINKNDLISFVKIEVLRDTQRLKFEVLLVEKFVFSIVESFIFKKLFFTMN